MHPDFIKDFKRICKRMTAKIIEGSDLYNQLLYPKSLKYLTPKKSNKIYTYIKNLIKASNNYYNTSIKNKNDLTNNIRDTLNIAINLSIYYSFDNNLKNYLSDSTISRNIKAFLVFVSFISILNINYRTIPSIAENITKYFRTPGEIDEFEFFQEASENYIKEIIRMYS